MGLNISSGAVTATINISAATKLTALTATAQRDNTGTVAVGTVPVGKVWRIISASIGCSSNTAAVGYCHLRIAANTILSCSALGLATASCCGSAKLDGDYEHAIVATEGQAIDLDIVNSGTGNILYIEENKP